MLSTFGSTIATALKAIRRNALRSSLTMLGVIIGVSAVIAMMEIGQGSTRAVQDTIARMGANNLMIQPGTAASGGINLGGGTRKTLTLEDSAAIASECSDLIESVAPTVRARTQVVYGNKNWVPYYLFGTTPEYLDVRDWTNLAEGRCFTTQEVRNGHQVCLLGQTIVRELFGAESPVGREVRVNQQPFTVIGVLEWKGANMMGFDQDDVLLAPWPAIKNRVSGQSVENVNQSASTANGSTTAAVSSDRRFPAQMASLYPPKSATAALNSPQIDRRTTVDVIWARTKNSNDIRTAKKQITDLLRRRHRLRADQPDDFSVRDLTEQNTVLGTTTQLMGTLLLIVALISLVVGGVGIMNIMLVSVTERTREIGLRMAIGARPVDVLRQFLTEAVLLCVAGGVFGILLGRGLSIAVREILAWPTEPSLLAIVASVGISVFVGVIFGFYPAWKASRLDPIQALRYE
jgi:ABC-type antimicrobial peptide transport system permease subunit